MSKYQPRHALARMVGSLPPRARVAIVTGVALAASGAGVAASASASAATTTTTCHNVSTSKGPLTAAVVNPTAPVGSLNAQGCDIGVYYNSSGNDSSLSDATVKNAKQYGVFVDGVDGATNVSVTESTVTNIGDDPFDGAQHGVGIYFNDGATGAVSGNTVSQYQKGGIVINGAGSSVSVTGNTVTGLGPVGFIAQNGIQISRGADASPDLVSGNTVSGNIYTQGAAKPYVSSGLLIWHASSTGTVGQYARSNHVFGNQANITVSG